MVRVSGGAKPNLHALLGFSALKGGSLDRFPPTPQLQGFFGDARLSHKSNRPCARKRLWKGGGLNCKDQHVLSTKCRLNRKRSTKFPTSLFLGCGDIVAKPKDNIMT